MRVSFKFLMKVVRLDLSLTLTDYEIDSFFYDETNQEVTVDETNQACCPRSCNRYMSEGLQLYSFTMFKSSKTVQIT